MRNNLKISSRFNKRATKEEVIAAKAVLDAVAEMLQEDLDASAIAMTKQDNYHLPKWEYLMADYVATQRTLKKVIDLITIKGESND